MAFTRRSSIVLIMASLLCLGVMPAVPVHAKEAGEQLVCLDPGHQMWGNNDPEPVAPGSEQKKAKVSSGTRGVKTKKPEYVLTLEASQLLREKLERFGYTVVMTRESHDVDISNVERAQMCNGAQADLAVRIHADGDSSPKTQGISLLYPAWSEETQGIYDSGKEAAELILEEAAAAAGAVSRGIVPRSDLTGFNWSEVPSVLVEMGFMTNPEEDKKLSDPDYLNRLTDGIAAGINKSLAVPAEEPEAAEGYSVNLPDVARLYELSNGRMIRTELALSPQTVQVSAARGSWAKVNTWVGEMWLYLK